MSKSLCTGGFIHSGFTFWISLTLTYSFTSGSCVAVVAPIRTVFVSLNMQIQCPIITVPCQFKLCYFFSSILISNRFCKIKHSQSRLKNLWTIIPKPCGFVELNINFEPLLQDWTNLVRHRKAVTHKSKVGVVLFSGIFPSNPLCKTKMTQSEMEKAMPLKSWLPWLCSTQPVMVVA